VAPADQDRDVDGLSTHSARVTQSAKPGWQGFVQGSGVLELSDATRIDTDGRRPALSQVGTRHELSLIDQPRPAAIGRDSPAAHTPGQIHRAVRPGPWREGNREATQQDHENVVMGASTGALKGRSTKKWAPAVALGLTVIATGALGVAPASATTIPPGSVQVALGQSAIDRQASKSAGANCPSDQRVLGGGAFTVGGIHAVITELQPIHTAGGDSFKVTAAADQFGIPAAWGFQVFAFCASVPAALGVEIIPHTNAPTSAGTDQAPTQCTAGKTLVGAGGKIENGNGQVDLGTFTNGSGSFAFGSAAFAKEDADGFAGNYTVTGYSVCARGNLIGDFQQFKTTTIPVSGPSQATPVACPSGLRLTGLAGGTVAPGTHLQRLSPRTTNAPGLADFGAQSSAPPNGPWTMETTVFCAK
jgi:hypothetical protein